MKISGQRKIGKPKLRWSDVIRKYIKIQTEEVEEWRT